MQTFDYSRLLESPNLERMLPQGVVPRPEIYRGAGGVQFCWDGNNPRTCLDIVQLSSQALLIASDYASADEQLHRQIITDTDWIHIQFRIQGSGRESIEDKIIETPERSCVITRYPKNSIIERYNGLASSWRVACLFISPRDLIQLLGAPSSRLPDRALWLAEGESELRVNLTPLRSEMMLAVSDIFSCSLSGISRQIYMRAKSLELLSMVLNEFDNDAAKVNSSVRLSKLDLQKLALALKIMSNDIEGALTLAELARKVGLNRTKLAVGFKETYGVSVQAYWRDTKLCRAREMLREQGARVTEVALSLGYSEISSFTRAFRRKFGVLPRTCKSPV